MTSAKGSIDEVVTYLFDRSDVVDGDDGKPEANHEMRLYGELVDATQQIAKLCRAARNAAQDEATPMEHQIKLRAALKAVDGKP